MIYFSPPITRLEKNGGKDGQIDKFYSEVYTRSIVCKKKGTVSGRKLKWSY